jgi:hypothetical protein
MPVTFTSTMAGASSDYMRYLWLEGSPLRKTDRYRDSDLLDFALVPWDASFVRLTRGSYIKIMTSTYGSTPWFTGYISNDPEPSWLGMGPGRSKVWGYRYQATSDEYILSLKPLGIIPPFLNTTAGDIIKRLVSKIAPGVFDVTGVDAGPMIAQFVVDPNKKFLEVIRELSEAVAYVCWSLDHKMYFKPQDNSTVGLTLDGNNKHFTPSQLSLRPSSSPIINDVLVLGDIEPREYVHEYFVGTGLDASFPLVSGVYGVDQSVLIDETFGGSSINSSIWTAYDQPQGYLKVDSGYLNCFGGNNYDVSLRTTSPLPLDGNMRFTHGEWDFLNIQNGIIGGLWTQAPNASLTGLLYGFKVGNLSLLPVVNGVEINDAPAMTLRTDRRYVIRTIAEFSRQFRASQQYNYLDSDGTVKSYGGGSDADSVFWNTIITEVDPSNGSITEQWGYGHRASINAAGATATYVPVASAGLSCTVTGITVSVPLNATLETATMVPFKNLSFEDWDDVNNPTDWANANNVWEEPDYSNDGTACKMQVPAGGLASVEQSASILLQPDTLYTVSARLLRHSTLTNGYFRIWVEGTYDDPDNGQFDLAFADQGLYVNNITTIPTNGFAIFRATLLSRYPSIKTATLRVECSSPGGGSMWVDSIVILSEFTRQIVGPNEVDAMDGMAPVATIVQGNTGSDTKSTYYGAPQFNPGQSQLVFFKDSLTRTSNIPPANQMIRLSYRAAGAAMARVVDRASILTESQSWVDDGFRSVVRSDLSPRPRTSEECEAAAAALVSENSYTHYEGTYTQWSEYFAAEPRAGGVVKFTNLSSLAPNLQAEEINEVVSEFSSIKPVERFRHTITFGKPDKIRQLLAKFDSRVGEFQKAASSVQIPVLDAKSIPAGKAYAPEVVKPFLYGWDADELFFDTDQALGSDGLYFEVRYTDDGWGVDAGKNLIARTTTQFFNVPRSLRGRVFFVRQANKGNRIKWSEDLSQSNYSGGTVTNSSKQNPDGDLSTISTVVIASGGTFTGTAAESGTGVFSFSVKGPAGKQMTAIFGSGSKSFTATGSWQRVSVAGFGSTVQVRNDSGASLTVDLTRFSVELGTSYETRYCKTTNLLYGPTSRYSTVVHVSFPVADTSNIVVTETDISGMVFRPTY